jgi:hypothetical protein
LGESNAARAYRLARPAGAEFEEFFGALLVSREREECMAEDFVIEKFAFKMVLKAVGILLLGAALLYVVDFAVWRARVAAGGGMGSVTVDMYTVADLKGGKEDYYANGTVALPCTKSIYPQEGSNPCWWVERHREMVQHY